MSENLQVIESPKELMRRSTDVAGVCKEIVLKTSVTISNRKYVRVEGWQSIATAHGCFCGADSSERVMDEQGVFIGYKAKGYVRNGRGEIIGTGEGFVGFDEKDRNGKATWTNRAEYAGRAMAQTRAISRAARSVFAHVVVLIGEGLSTIPAEEVPADGFDDAPKRQEASTASRGESGEQSPFDGQKTPTGQPAKQGEASQADAPEDSQTVTGIVAAQTKKGPNARGGFRYGIKINDVWVNTFDVVVATNADLAKHTRKPVTVTYVKGRYGNDVIALSLNGQEEGGNRRLPGEREVADADNMPPENDDVPF